MKKINWTETLVVATIEGVLVLVGVLLGFYFENLRDRNESQELLKRDLKLLSLELTEVNKMRMGDVDMKARDFFSDAAVRLDSSLRKIEKMSPGELKDLSTPILSLIWSGNMEQRPYALDMMINSGSFSLIKNDLLKTELMIVFPKYRRSILEMDLRDRNHDYYKSNFKDNSERIEYKKDELRRTRERYVAYHDYINQVVKIDSLIQLEIR